MFDQKWTYLTLKDAGGSPHSLGLKKINNLKLEIMVG